MMRLLVDDQDCQDGAGPLQCVVVLTNMCNRGCWLRPMNAMRCVCACTLTGVDVQVVRREHQPDTKGGLRLAHGSQGRLQAWHASARVQGVVLQSCKYPCTGECASQASVTTHGVALHGACTHRLVVVVHHCSAASQACADDGPCMRIDRMC